MNRLLASGIDCVVRAGYLYLPLLFDPDMEQEINATMNPSRSYQTSGPDHRGAVIETGGKRFIKTFNLHSLVANYEKIGKSTYDQVESTVLDKVGRSEDRGGISFSRKLITIVFEIVPYFIKLNKGFERRELSKEEILELVAEKVDIPAKDYTQTMASLDLQPLRETLRDLQRLDTTYELPDEGLISSHQLSGWLHEALRAVVIDKEIARLKNEIRERQEFIDTVKDNINILLHILEEGSLEINGFGFTRIGDSDDYVVFKHTGEYILKDYYGRSYLFPDCRVAVSTGSTFRPMVIEKYKHPFLYAHDSWQEICMRGFSPPQEFSAKNIILALEEGINALVYGFDARRRNGYHSLDPTRQYVKTVEFADYRMETG
jgi:hypothetical protein